MTSVFALFDISKKDFNFEIQKTPGDFIQFLNKQNICLLKQMLLGL